MNYWPRRNPLNLSYISGLSSRVEYLPKFSYCPVSSQNVITLPGLHAAALATPVEIDTIPKTLNSLKPSGNPLLSYHFPPSHGVSMKPKYYLLLPKDPIGNDKRSGIVLNIKTAWKIYPGIIPKRQRRRRTVKKKNTQAVFSGLEYIEDLVASCCGKAFPFGLLFCEPKNR